MLNVIPEMEKRLERHEVRILQLEAVRTTQIEILEVQDRAIKQLVSYCKVLNQSIDVLESLVRRLR